MATAKKAAPKKAAVVKEEQPIEEQPIEVNPVKPGDVKLEGMMHQNWALFAPSHYGVDELESPKFWTFMAPKFKDLDAVRITAEDGSWVARGYIRRSISMEVSCQIETWFEMQDMQIAEEIQVNDYVIRHFGAVRKFVVVNTTTRNVVKEGFQTQADALKYITSQIEASQRVAKTA